MLKVHLLMKRLLLAANMEMCLSTAQVLFTRVPLGSALCLLPCPFSKEKHFISVITTHALCSVAFLITVLFLSPGLTCRLSHTSLSVRVTSPHGFMPVCRYAGCPSVFGYSCCCSFMTDTSCAMTSLLSIPLLFSLTVKTYYTTLDSQLPCKTNIIA